MYTWNSTEANSIYVLKFSKQWVEIYPEELFTPNKANYSRSRLGLLRVLWQPLHSCQTSSQTICKDSWVSCWKWSNIMPLPPNFWGSSLLLTEATWIRATSQLCLEMLVLADKATWIFNQRTWKLVNSIVMSVWLLNTQPWENGSHSYCARGTNWEIVSQIFLSAKVRNQFPILAAFGPKLAEESKKAGRPRS